MYFTVRLRSICTVLLSTSFCLSVRLSNACIVTKRKHLGKKVQLWLIGIDYELSNEPKMNSVRCPLTPKEASKTKIYRFPYKKVGFSWRKSATKFFFVFVTCCAPHWYYFHQLWTLSTYLFLTYNVYTVDTLRHAVTLTFDHLTLSLS